MGNFVVNKARISVILPRNACTEIRKCMIKDGYSLREKSKWYSEAIKNFLDLPNYQDFVEMAVLVDDLSQIESLYIPSELDDKLENSIITVREKFPALEGVKSLIIRASIIRRLISSSTFQI